MHHIDIEKARGEMVKRDLDVLIAASLLNVCYCTGYYSEIWDLLKPQLRLAVVPKDSAPFVTCPDVEASAFARSGVFEVFEYPISMYYTEEKIKNIPELKGLDIRDMHVKSPVLLAAKILKDRGLGGANIGIDKEYVDAASFEEVVKTLPDCEITDGTQIFLDLRATKSDEEISNLVEAIRVTEKAVEDSMPLIKEGGRLDDIRRNFIQVMSEKETYGISHLMFRVTPSMADKLKAGQVFNIDVGAKYNNYSADIARQWAIGEIPKKEWEVFDTVLEAVDAMVEKLSPGTKLSDIYWTGNEIMRKADANYGRVLLMGHAVGLEGHERPYISPFAEETLKPGMVLNIEPPYMGDYFHNAEDTYLITHDGHQLLSTRTSRQMLQV